MAHRLPDRSGDIEAVIETINDYAEAFGRADIDAIASYCAAPLSVIRPQGVMLLRDETKIRAGYAAMLAELKARGYSHSVWATLNVRVLEERTALASGIPVRFTRDGRELERLGSTYLLRKGEEGWKIVVMVVHDAATVVALD